MNGAAEPVVAVVRALDDVRRTHRATCAALVLHEHLLAECQRKLGRKRPTERIDAASGRERVDDRDRLGRPALRLRGETENRERAYRRGAHELRCSCHASPWIEPVFSARMIAATAYAAAGRARRAA